MTLFFLFPYSNFNLTFQLWNALKTNQRLTNDEMVSKEWVDLGFQSKDPSTDFRGMGLLGLANLT
jgi:hypothetical protein